MIPGIEGHPEVFEIDYTAARELVRQLRRRRARGPVGIHWHTDVTFVKRPPLGSILRAVVVPPAGGDTLFSDQQAAFESLSPALQGFLSTLTAVHDGRAQFKGVLDLVGEGDLGGRDVHGARAGRAPRRADPPRDRRPHRCSSTPASRRTSRSWSGPRATPSCQFLYAHSVKPEHTVRYHWHTGDIGFWDNRATQHAVVGDFGDQHRVIQRVTLRGDEPR